MCRDIGLDPGLQDGHVTSQARAASDPSSMTSSRKPTARVAAGGRPVHAETTAIVKNGLGLDERIAELRRAPVPGGWVRRDQQERGEPQMRRARRRGRLVLLPQRPGPSPAFGTEHGRLGPLARFAESAPRWEPASAEAFVACLKRWHGGGVEVALRAMPVS
jgi:hypothetical protein